MRARYRLLPYAGGFNESRAHRFGQEVLHSQPLLQQFGEPRDVASHLSASGALLHLPGSHDPVSAIVTLSVKPSADGSGMVVRMVNASDEPQIAALREGQLQIVSAWRCTLLEASWYDLPVENGAIELNLAARELAAVHIVFGNQMFGNQQ